MIFSNPGTMLITVEEFFECGHSICRNRILQKMFIVFGRGERLGSGADIIRQGGRKTIGLNLRLKSISALIPTGWNQPYVWALYPQIVRAVQ